MKEKFYLAIPKVFTIEGLKKRLGGLGVTWEFNSGPFGSFYSSITGLPNGELRFVSVMEGGNPRPDAWTGFLEFSYYPQHELLFRVMSLSITANLARDCEGTFIEFVMLGEWDEVFSYVRDSHLVINARFMSYYPISHLKGFKTIEIKAIPSVRREQRGAYPTFEN